MNEIHDQRCSELKSARAVGADYVHSMYKGGNEKVSMCIVVLCTFDCTV